MSTELLQFEPVAIGYWAPFLVTALVCFSAVGRAAQIEAPDVRRGLVWLLATTGLWAVFKVGYFLLPGPFKNPAYLVGLVFGFAAVWAWLYFCSAYTGRTYHREPTFRWLAGAIYGLVVAVKVTNPLHHLYFETAFVTDPFPHLAIQQGMFHWAVTGFSYALAAAGIFMLLDLFVSSDYDTWPLAVLAGLTGLPVTLDIVGYATPLLVDIIYAPIGVGAFLQYPDLVSNLVICNSTVLPMPADEPTYTTYPARWLPWARWDSPWRWSLSCSAPRIPELPRYWWKRSR